MISTVLSLLSRFFRWWFGELVGCVPRRLRHALAPARKALLLYVGDTALEFRLLTGGAVQELGSTPVEADGSALGGIPQGLRHEGIDVVLLLPSAQLLRRRLTLPLAAAENLREILSLELDRHAPFPVEEAAFDYRVLRIDRDNQEIAVELAIAARSSVERAQGLATRLGLEVARVDVSSDGGDPQGWKLSSANAPEPPSSPYRRINMGLVAAICVLVALSLWLPLERKHRELAEYDVRLSELRLQAADVESLRDAIAGQLNRRQFVSRERASVPMAIAVLDEATRRLPDDSWVIQMRLDRRSLQMSGYAPAAADLIPAFEESPLFENVRFAAPVTPDPRVNLERFILSLPLDATTGSQ